MRVAPNPPERPGYTAPPLVWSRVDPAESRATGKPIPLLVQAFFSFYSGPAMVDGHLMIRGRALSTGLDLASSWAR